MGDVIIIFLVINLELLLFYLFFLQERFRREERINIFETTMKATTVVLVIYHVTGPKMK